jgi:plastocyanin
MKSRTQLAIGMALAVTLAVPMARAQERPEMAVTVQFGQPKFPQDPPPLNRIMVPDEVTVGRGGTVNFEINGGGHAIAIYPVSNSTTRADIEAGLCQPDPATCDPQGAATSDLRYIIREGSGLVVVDTDTNPPQNRVNDPIGRMIYAGGPVFLTGRTTDTPTVQQIEYRFERAGRYLVICADRNHFINDHMFGFVNVVRKNGRLPED